MSEFRVKGSTMQYKIEFLEKHAGPQAVEELKRHFKGRKLFPILDSSWYPYELYDELLRRTADLCFGGDQRRHLELSASWADVSLTGVYEAYRWGDNLADFLDRLPRLHARMFTEGRLTVQTTDDGGTHRIILSDAHRYSDAALYSAAGFYLGAARVLGFAGAACRFERQGQKAVFALEEAAAH